MVQENKYLISSIEKLFYIVLDLNVGISLSYTEKNKVVIFDFFYKVNNLLFEKLKKLCGNYHLKLFVIYAIT